VHTSLGGQRAGHALPPPPPPSATVRRWPRRSSRRHAMASPRLAFLPRRAAAHPRRTTPMSRAHTRGQAGATCRSREHTAVFVPLLARPRSARATALICTSLWSVVTASGWGRSAPTPFAAPRPVRAACPAQTNPRSRIVRARVVANARRDPLVSSLPLVSVG
jgi:hypothetical protein